MSDAFEVDSRLTDEVARQPYPLVFVTISGAHLYGFPSSDSDYDLRGVHVLPPHELLGLDAGPLTLEAAYQRDGVEFDLVTHDTGKFFGMLLKRNGYVLEQLHSPLIVQAMPEHAELIEIAHGCVTRHHVHHYLGFSATQWRLFENEQPRRVKPLLYMYRVLLTGIHLMRTGQVEANLVRLNEEFRLPQIPDLIDRKRSGSERATLPDADLAFHEREHTRLVAALDDAAATTHLPDTPSGRPALNDLLLRLRLSG